MQGVFASMNGQSLKFYNYFGQMDLIQTGSLYLRHVAGFVLRCLFVSLRVV